MKLILLLFLTLHQLYGAPAFNKVREFTNADGSKFTAQGRGDQYLNWIETEDGTVLKFNQESQNFEYAEILDNRLLPSGKKYRVSNVKKSNSFVQDQKINSEELSKLWQYKRQNIMRVYK